VGKSALGYRLIHGRFERQESTHGQQFWVFPALGRRRADGTDCEAILWDFAGQPDYRLVHALFVDNADLALINNRLLGTEPQKQSVLPLLLDGEKAASLPPLLHGRVYADFRNELAYFATAFDLILSLYQLPPNHPVVAGLRESLRGPDIR
jgi:hypothetical protein